MGSDSQLLTSDSQLRFPAIRSCLGHESRAFRSQRWRNVMRPRAQLGQGNHAHAALEKNPGNKMVTNIAAHGLPFDDSQKFRIAEAFTGRSRGGGEVLGLSGIAAERHRMHKSARAVAAVGQLDAYRIARSGELPDTHAPLREAQNFCSAEKIGGPGPRVAAGADFRRGGRVSRSGSTCSRKRRSSSASGSRETSPLRRASCTALEGVSSNFSRIACASSSRWRMRLVAGA